MIRLVVALEAEARPLVEHFRLAPDPDHHAFRIYRQGEVALAVCGPGKAAAAAATAYLFLAAGGGRDAVWLNVGVAGHRDRAVGEAVLAHKVRDRAAGRSWYPPQLADPPCATDEVVTVERPEVAFAEPGAHEMEAAGFYPTACRFASAELVHCLKVISDGPEDRARRLAPREVTALIAARLPAIAGVVDGVSELSAELRALAADPPDLDRCLERWRFTVSDRRELRRLLRRRQTLAPERALPELPPRLRGREVNRRLREWLDSLPVAI